VTALLDAARAYVRATAAQRAAEAKRAHVQPEVDARRAAGEALIRAAGEALIRAAATAPATTRVPGDAEMVARHLAAALAAMWSAATPAVRETWAARASSHTARLAGLLGEAAP
jgi:hypothetical protein